MSDEPQISGWSVFGGALVGLFIGLGIFGADAFLATLIRPPRGSPRSLAAILYVLVNAGVLFTVGFAAFRQYNTSGFARGIAIGLAVMFMLNGICGVVLFAVHP